MFAIFRTIKTLQKTVNIANSEKQSVQLLFYRHLANFQTMSAFQNTCNSTELLTYCGEIFVFNRHKSVFHRLSMQRITLFKLHNFYLKLN